MKTKIKDKNNEKTLKTKLLFSFLSVGILPLIIFALICGVIIKSSMYSSEILSLKQISRMITDNLDNWADDNVILVEDIATSQTVYSTDIDSIQQELRNKQGQDTGILNIMYVDTNGNIIADSLGSKGENISSEPYFKDVSKGYSYVSDVLVYENNLSYIIFSSPVKQNNKVIGYIVNKVKTESIEDSIGTIFYSEDGQVYTFNNNGYITYHNDYTKIMNENILESSSELSKGAQKALDGNFNSINYTYNGEKGVAVYNFIPSLKWGTMTTTPNSEIYKGFKNAFITVFPIVMVIIALIVGVALYILKLFTKPINEMASLTKEVANGDLSVQCDLTGASEITNIGNDLNEMVNSLRNLVISIDSKSNDLKDASVELEELASSAEENSRDISSAMTEIADTSVAQASKTDDILSYVRNLDEKISEVTKKLGETNSALKISDGALKKGNKGTKELKNSTEEQFKLVGQAVDEVNELSQFVLNIDRIIETISEISNQTSLLALNASIEAARAGESGKGFAVVAEEVGKLANESKEATQETAEILNTIRNKADLTTKLMSSIDEGMKVQNLTVNETLAIFDEITNADSKISDNIKSFNNLIDYIKDFSENLLELIETLASSSEESAAVSEEVTASSENQISVVEKVKVAGDKILKVVDELKVNIDKFKTE